MDNQLPESNEHNLILALDWMNPQKVSLKLDAISTIWRQELENDPEIVDYMSSVLWKVNDLMAWIWFEWLQGIFKDVKWWIMIDGKWNDIWATNINYLVQLANYPELARKVKYITIHASNWQQWLKEAVYIRNKFKCLSHIKILAVTALTTLTDDDTNIIFDENRKHSVLKLAKEALEAWVIWIVCSPKEAQVLRDVFSEKYFKFLIITPWVRFKGWDHHDQKNVETPRTAIEKWANDIVMWRPILWSEDILASIKQFFEEIKGVWYCNDEQRHEFEKLLYTWSWEQLLKYIWAFYNRTEWWKYCRLASWLLSNAYINIWATERNYLVVERAANEMALEVKKQWIEADIIMWAQMWSIRLSLYLAEKLWIEESIYTEKNNPEKEALENIRETINDSTLKEFNKSILTIISQIVNKKYPDSMSLKRHDISLKWKKIILNEDIITEWTTIERMTQLIEEKGWEIVAITCVWNRYWKSNYNWIPIISCYNPPAFELYYDDKTPGKARWDYPKLEKGSKISEKAKDDWAELVESMRK